MVCNGRLPKFDKSTLLSDRDTQISPGSIENYVILSAICSAAVYKPKDPIPPAAISLTPLYYSEPSADATKKAFGIWYFRTSPISPGTLIVAIRGTKLRRDHSVNMNGDGQEVGQFIVCVPKVQVFVHISIRLTMT